MRSSKQQRKYREMVTNKATKTGIIELKVSEKDCKINHTQEKKM